ncbi:SDR family NAD(P)-dependent oxidoreductase [Tardiphaga sp. 20_F10_N6_6]|jgi:NAD(P)-dependent dehydrogenase (short-subunit alcohol dehydrogenase family)|uniref:SDR family NAD(P)-dependent oxidoreductase n=1 Tax=unclassified Tardiphaga TaxID=2631404 RepID=UPI003F1E55B6
MTSSEKSPFDLTGQRIVIAGAAGGIGSATAKLCAQQGATLVLVDIAGKDRIRERVGAEVADRSEIYGLDTGSRADVTALARQTGPVYGLIDTAAIAPHDDWMAEDWEESLDRVIRANVKGPINLTRAFLPGMMEAGEGRIVLCGSVAGWMGGLRTGPHYAFAKGGIHSFVRWLASKAAPRNVLVNGIAPGPVETAMTEGKGYDTSLYPLKRMAKPEEIAATAVFLCGAGSGYASGAIFDINGATHFH